MINPHAILHLLLAGAVTMSIGILVTVIVGAVIG